MKIGLGNSEFIDFFNKKMMNLKLYIISTLSIGNVRVDFTNFTIGI